MPLGHCGVGAGREAVARQISAASSKCCRDPRRIPRRGSSHLAPVGFGLALQVDRVAHLAGHLEGHQRTGLAGLREESDVAVAAAIQAPADPDLASRGLPPEDVVVTEEPAERGKVYVGPSSAGWTVGRDRPSQGMHLRERHRVPGMRRRAEKVGIACAHAVGISAQERKGNTVRDYSGTLHPSSPELSRFVLVRAPRASARS